MKPRDKFAPETKYLVCDLRNKHRKYVKSTCVLPFLKNEPSLIQFCQEVIPYMDVNYLTEKNVSTKYKVSKYLFIPFQQVF